MEYQQNIVVEVGVKGFGQLVSCQCADARNKVTDLKAITSGEIWSVKVVCVVGNCYTWIVVTLKLFKKKHKREVFVKAENTYTPR